jgi:hypothetical protein
MAFGSDLRKQIREGFDVGVVEGDPPSLRLPPSLLLWRDKTAWRGAERGWRNW